MRHPHYCVSNSLVILRKYWSQEDYDKCVSIQNNPFAYQTKDINQGAHNNFERAIELESNNYQSQQQ